MKLSDIAKPIGNATCNSIELTTKEIGMVKPLSLNTEASLKKKIEKNDA